MKLGVFDRLVLLNILPREGDILSLRQVRRLREALSFSDEEHAALGLHVCSGPNTDCDRCSADPAAAGQVHWKTEAEVLKEVDIGPRAAQIITDALKALNDGRKLREEHIPLFERFVEEP